MVERDEMQEHAGALDVLQELGAEADALARPRDETGDVGHHETRAALLRAAEYIHDAEHRDQRGERVVGDLRPRAADRRDERGSATSKADEAKVAITFSSNAVA